jgi:chemotaxis protein MotA
MLVIIGWVVALLTIFIPYLMSGGMMGPLVQPGKFIMIFGAAFGAAIAASNMHAFKHMMGSLGQLLQRLQIHQEPSTWSYSHCSSNCWPKCARKGLMSLEGMWRSPRQEPHFHQVPLDYTAIITSLNSSPITCA